MMMHLSEARELMERFPQFTKGLSVIEVMTIWEAYSNNFAAGWLIPDEEGVMSAFRTPAQDEATK